eukprot:GHUV01012766.1.p1 GENE.GHUV01012766.1~~GHUV01012766.1.p1  ORF type:complete len:186 (+),score=42.35 GHUV01012766.1:516-1073(+)
MKGPHTLGCLAVCLLLIGSAAAGDYCPSYSNSYAAANMAPAERIRRVREVWQQQQHKHQPLNRSCLAMLKRQTWEMFDHGFSNYMKHAFPKDNLLPISCKGADWQGGVGLTLIDSLDMLLLLNRRADIQEALKQLAWTVSFDKDQKVRSMSLEQLARHLQQIRPQSAIVTVFHGLHGCRHMSQLL